MRAFYFDHHVQAAIAEGLRTRGIRVLTAFDDGFAEHDDESLLARSTDLERIFVTYDRDFLTIASQWQSQGRNFPGIVFGFKERVEIGMAIRYLEDLAKHVPADTIANSVAYLPRTFQS